jgi:uncharacterized protein (DUF2141 family)
MFQTFKPLLLVVWAMMLLGKTPSTTKAPVYQLKIKIDKLILHTGKIMIAVYSNEHDFLTKPILKKKVSLEELKHDIVFTNLKVGDYAVTLFQDLDGDGKLNKIFSVPTEPYGLSNNPDGFPAWRETKFKINQNKTITITLKN